MTTDEIELESELAQSRAREVALREAAQKAIDTFLAQDGTAKTEIAADDAIHALIGLLDASTPSPDVVAVGRAELEELRADKRRLVWLLAGGQMRINDGEGERTSMLNYAPRFVNRTTIDDHMTP